MRMHIVLVLSYAFSLWMIVDAYRRHATFYWYLIIFFPFGEWVYFFLVKWPEWRAPGGLLSGTPRFKCETCRHCGGMQEDGVHCRVGGTSTFKTAVHINYCTAHEERAAKDAP
jgi:hypothetical protein